MFTMFCIICVHNIVVHVSNLRLCENNLVTAKEIETEGRPRKNS